METVTIPSRFNGPPTSANGGYACGAVAQLIDGRAEVTLRKPPPLATPMAVERQGDEVRLLHEGVVVIEARPASSPIEPPPPVAWEQAVAARRTPEEFLQNHVFPTCFACGPARADGLGLFVGPVEESELMAAPWVPDASLSTDGKIVDPEAMWAALDCPSGWSAIESNATRETMVLGRLTATIARPAEVGERLIATSAALGRDGRKHFASAGLYTPEGELLAHAYAVWIVIG